MPASWRANAVVWLNDQKRGRVVTGAFGFAWWEGRKVYVAAFLEYSTNPVVAYMDFTDWNDVRVYSTAESPIEEVVRFVKTGLFPAQGKLA